MFGFSFFVGSGEEMSKFRLGSVSAFAGSAGDSPRRSKSHRFSFRHMRVVIQRHLKGYFKDRMLTLLLDLYMHSSLVLRSVNLWLCFTAVLCKKCSLICTIRCISLADFRKVVSFNGIGYS